MNIRELKKNWDALGKTDPFWAILSYPEKKGNRWEAEQFFKTGLEEIEKTLGYVRGLGVELRYGIALDFGCGAGRLTQGLVRHFAQAIGVDIAPSMIAGSSVISPKPSAWTSRLR